MNSVPSVVKQHYLSAAPARSSRSNALHAADSEALTMSRSRPYLVGERSSYIYYPNCSDVGIGADLLGRVLGS